MGRSKGLLCRFEHARSSLEDHSEVIFPTASLRKPWDRHYPSATSLTARDAAAAARCRLLEKFCAITDRAATAIRNQNRSPKIQFRSRDREGSVSCYSPLASPTGALAVGASWRIARD